MSNQVYSTNASGAGTASVVIQHNKSGVVWLVAQTSVRTIPVGTGVTSEILLNGLLVTNTALGSGDSAQGPPAFMLSATDKLQVNWTGAPANSQCIAVVFYQEFQEGEVPLSAGIVV